jgi:hypothetical protein
MHTLDADTGNSRSRDGKYDRIRLQWNCVQLSHGHLHVLGECHLNRRALPLLSSE